MFKIEKGKKYIHPNAKSKDTVLEAALQAFKELKSDDESFFIPANKLDEKKINYFVSKIAKVFPKIQGIKVVTQKEFVDNIYAGVRVWRHEFNVVNSK